MNESALRAALAALLPEDRAARLAASAALLPDPREALDALSRFAAAAGRLPEDDALLGALLTLAGFSPYLGGLLARHPEYLAVLSSGGPAARPRGREDLEQDLARFLLLNATQDPSAVLRRFKEREYLRIALSDFQATADLAAITRALSLLADVLLDRAVRLARATLEARFGTPTSRGDQGHLEEARFAVIALGKLGGEELNYSSDIDLLYLFSRDGETTGAGGAAGGPIGNREFFLRLAAEVTRMISGPGPEGQAFRVDLGLRPGGRDGDLAISIGAAVAYYRNWAQLWERQALLKARAAAGDLEMGRRFVRLVEPLAYPPAPDPYLIPEIAAMKDRIDARLSEEGRSEIDIKLGRGGIRELEFALQALQIERGGKDPWLRQGNTLLALHRLAERGVLGYADYSALGQAYVFLRDLEHRLQLGQNRQTSTLPASIEERAILARRMRIALDDPRREALSLDEHLERHRGAVRGFYDTIFGRGAQVRITDEVTDLWLDPLDDAALVERLRRSGLASPETLLKPVRSMRALLQGAARSPEIRRAIHKAGPALAAAAAGTPDPRRAFMNLERLLASLVEDADGLLHFLSHREILAPTVRLLGRSDFLAGLLIRHPGFLRRLEDRALLLKTPDRRDALDFLVPGAAEPARARERAPDLRRRHQEALATIALRDINRQATVRETLKSLSSLAEATTEAAVVLAREEMAGRGEPLPPGLRLAILGLGRLGYREMDYGSDLDIVFVRAGTEVDPAAGRAAQRLCEGIVRILSAVSREGQLYRIDLRLRPSGREGPLVTTVEALRDYFRTSAEIWEMQSFLKARPAAGDLELGNEAVEAITSLVFDRARILGAAEIALAVEEMRRRLAGPGRGAGGRPSVKLGEGGLLDIHFIIEFLQLRHAVPNPPDQDTLRLLTHLAGLGHIAEEPMRHLYEAYLFLRTLDHEARLLHDRPPEALPAETARLAELAQAIDPAAGTGAAAAARLMESFRAHTAAVRRVYESIVTPG